MGAGQIFLDTQKITSKSSLVHQRYFQPEKRPDPVIVADRPWEAGGVQYGTVINDNGLLRLWYFAQDPHWDDDGVTCYAESTDGINWHKPDLGVVERDGSTKNNIVHTPLEGPSVVIDERESDPAKRYKSLGYVRLPETNTRWGTSFPRTAFYTAHSADGYTWTPDDSGTPQIDLRWDEGRMVYDAPRGRYLATVKKDHPYAFHDRRSVNILVSDDSVQWTPPMMMLVPDELDDQKAVARGFTAADFYGLAVYPREDLLIGFLWIHEMWPPFHPRRTLGIFSRVHVQLAYSYDGFVWHRTTGRPPFIDVGERGAWDAGSVYTANSFVELGDDVLMLYSGARQMHGHTLNPENWHEPRPGLTEADVTAGLAIGLATIKRDRFAAMSCDDIGEFTVLHGPRRGNRLTVNARTGCGQIQVQVEDDARNLIPGFSFDESTTFTGDQLNAEIGWGSRTLAELPEDQPITLRFKLQDADLFAYRIED